MSTMISLLLAATTALAPAAAPVADPVKLVQFTPADQAAALAHWTPERMRAVGQESADRAERVAKPWAGQVPRGVGRLFVTERPGPETWCTATAVARDVVLTAAHCVWPGFTRWEEPIEARNVVFAPGYDQGRTPLGVFAAKAFLIQETYPRESNPDVAMVVLAPRDGQHVGDLAGTQRLSFTPPGSAQTTILGYPGSKAGLGERLFRCEVTAKPAGRWNTPCDMAGGSSGGPWFTGFDQRTGLGTIYSVTSKGAMEVDESTGEVYTKELEGTRLSAADRVLLTRAERV
ncbi:trypsin-like serine peptidase [Crossiella cryophila]|uniref:trypsin-like serine peptidase n=1 Tax=Crossiella cryophila TaxID=43355 RepID=UPI0031E805FF